MNILYIDPVIQTKTAKTYSYYNGMYDALWHQEGVRCYVCSDTGLAQKALSGSASDCEAIYLGIGFFGQNKDVFKTTAFADFKCKKIAHMFKPQNHFDEKLKFCINNKVDLIVSSIPSYKKFEKETGIKSERMMYAADRTVFYDRKCTKIYDVGFSGALHDARHYPKGAFAVPDMRRKIQDILGNMSIKSLLNGSDKLKKRIRKYNDYAEKISQSKIWIATPAPFGDITPRYFEVPLSNTLLMCSEVHDSYKDVFIDGENCVMFKNDLSDFKEKVDYYLCHDDERQQIVNRAYVEFHVRHSWGNRAKQLLGYIDSYVKDKF